MLKIVRHTLLNNFSTLRSSKTAGFIGLGNMGGPMALNLKNKGGYEVYGFDAIPQTRKLYKEKGLQVVEDLQELPSKTDIIVTMLPNHKFVQQVLYAPTGLFKLLKKGSLVLDCSTIAPGAALEIHQKAKEHSINFVDSPVSGGVPAAVAGTLTFMAGTNDKTIFEQAKEVLQHMGKNVINTEKEGAGQIAKACNNMALAIEMQAVSEALSLGKKLGIDSKVLTQIMNISSASCWSTLVYNPVPGVLENVPSSKNYDGGFACELMLKDLTIAIEAAKSVGQDVPYGQASQQTYKKIVEGGENRKDFSIIYDKLLNNKL